MTMETKIYSLIVKPKGEPLFSEQATKIGVEDEAGGVFFVIEQDGGKIRVDESDWFFICTAVERLKEEWGA